MDVWCQFALVIVGYKVLMAGWYLLLQAKELYQMPKVVCVINNMHLTSKGRIVLRAGPASFGG